MIKRFVDNNRPFYTYAYQQKIWVKCPKCDKLGFVWREKIDDNYTTKFVCSACVFRVHQCFNSPYRQSYWDFQANLQGYFGKCLVSIDEKCPCKEGKFRFEQTYESKAKIPNCFSIHCSFCKQAKNFYAKDGNVRIQPFRALAIDTDPFLHYSLYLSESTSLGKIFAFNPNQLATLKDYVTATLRENTHYHRSYFSILPRWIKSAKNRDLVLKAIGKLENEIAQTPDFSAKK